MRAEPTGTCTPHVPGRVYEVTQVLSWWLREPAEPPTWLPTMGGLHEDTEFFGFPVLHYHVDPRFLSVEMQACAEKTQEKSRRYELYPDYEPWHPAYHRVLCDFPGENQDEYFTITTDRTAIWRRSEASPVRAMAAAWGLKRIRTRRRHLECLRDLPAAANEYRIGKGFLELRTALGDAVGDICPHRGYDLRNVPIVEGYRRCPLHQLLVRAVPQRAQPNRRD